MSVFFSRSLNLSDNWYLWHATSKLVRAKVFITCYLHPLEYARIPLFRDRL